MIWVAGRSPTLVSHSLRGVAMNLKATTLTYLAISVLISDNAPIHHKKRIRELVEGAGHIVLFLPTYSPDLNAIEHDFSALKRLWMYAPPGTTIDEIIRNYCTS